MCSLPVPESKMVAVRGHYDGHCVILDEVLPQGVAAGAAVQVIFAARNTDSDGDCRSLVDAIWPLMGSIDGPSDLSEEHDHYAHGAPKRSDRDG